MSDPLIFPTQNFFSMAEESYLSVCPIHWYFQLKTSFLWQKNPTLVYVRSTDISTVLFAPLLFSLVHISTVFIRDMLGQKILKIFLSHLCINVYRSFAIHCGTFHVQAWHYFKKFATVLIKYRNHQNVESQDLINLFIVLLAFSLIVGHAFLAVKRVGRQVGESWAVTKSGSEKSVGAVISVSKLSRKCFLHR
jgi:hypothetical protein